jgi:hypothetical protein
MWNIAGNHVGAGRYGRQRKRAALLSEPADWTLGDPVKPVGQQGVWSPEILGLIERAKSFGLTLAPVGAEPWGWELRREDGELIVHGNASVIEATLKKWPDGESPVTTGKQDGEA